MCHKIIINTQFQKYPTDFKLLPDQVLIDYFPTMIIKIDSDIIASNIIQNGDNVINQDNNVIA